MARGLIRSKKSYARIYSGLSCLACRSLLLIFITHQLTKSREEKGRAAVREDSGNSERRTRKNDLLKFLSTWENEIRLGIGIHGAVARTFDERKSELIRLTSISAGDYAAEFSAMAQAITDMRGGEVDKKNQEGGKYQFIGAEKLLGMVRWLAAFVASN